MRLNYRKLRISGFGFTLIELLAIIVILSIIALIAMPVALNVINDTKISARESSANGIVEVARLYQSEWLVNDDVSLKENLFDVLVDCTSGKNPDSGEVLINSNGKISVAIKYDDYCLIKEYDDTQFTEVVSDSCIIPVTV